jgi:hypothetical protein
VQSDPAALLNKYGVNFCLLNRDCPKVRVLPLHPGWKFINTDANSVIIARNNQAQKFGG